jgi:hypothetical protein
MLRPNGWIVVPIALVLVGALALRLEGGDPRVADRRELAVVSPYLPLALGGCATVTEREEYERTDCLQSVRVDLIEGFLDVDQALERLEGCAWIREDLHGLAERQARLRTDRYRVRVAYGETLTSAEAAEYERLRAGVGGDRGPVSAAAVRRLRVDGITASGIAPGRQAEVLRRLARDESMRADFRAVFGDDRADDLEALLGTGSAAGGAVLQLGETLVIPNRAPMLARSDGSITIAASAESEPLVVGTEAYSTRLAAELRALEVARLRYLASAARQNQRTGSIRDFVAAVRRLGAMDEEAAARGAETERHRAVLTARLENLDRRLGVDPLLGRMAAEGVGLAFHINQGCGETARQHRRRIRAGAGVVTGLVGAAGVVVAAGATGTMLGSLTIAAAVEASLGAYLIARSERMGSVAVSGAGRPLGIPRDFEDRVFRRPDVALDLLEGDDGTGGGHLDEWFEDHGEAGEWGLEEGESVEEESGETTEQRPRENMILAMLPIDMSANVWELPPLLDNPLLQQLRELRLPEIRERLDEFLMMNDPSSWARFAEDEDLSLLSVEEMVAEAEAALKLWEVERVLAERFGGFFVQAEVARSPRARRAETLKGAMGRYLHDRSVYRGTRDMDELRKRLGARLVAHCRSGPAAGDLVLSACTDETALSTLIIAAWRDANVPLPLRNVLGVQAFGNRLEAVLYSRERDEVYSLTKGVRTQGVVAPIYHPATFYYGFLLEHGVAPDIDPEQHLLIALPNRASTRQERNECTQEERRSVVGRAIEFLGSMVGIRRIAVDDECSEGGGAGGRGQGGDRDGGVSVDVSIPGLRNPLQQGGSGQSGGASGGGGSGGGRAMAGGTSSNSGGGSSSDGGASGSGGGEGAGSSEGSSSAGEGGGTGSEGTGSGAGGNEILTRQGIAELEGQGAEAGADSAGVGGEARASAGSEGSGGSGGYGIGTAPTRRGPDLVGIGHEAVKMAEEYEKSPSTRIAPWRLREDEGMLTGSSSRVLYADNARALERFDRDDAFLTLTPAEVEAQRRMLEADRYPIFPVDTGCEAEYLPPRGVFRRISPGEEGFRYVYCDLNESMVIFRTQRDALSYAALSPADRPLYLARLAAERLEVFERSLEMIMLNGFLTDPNMLRARTRDEIFAMVKAAQDLLVFQNTLESALVQTMSEIDSYEAVRPLYYQLHQQVLQAPLFIQMAESAYRLNQRLASDPLQSLAWANSQPKLARQGFFELYHTVGRMMAWPERWAILQQRYAGEMAPPPPDFDGGTASLDFLQILSDPTRVQVDWRAEDAGTASIRDRQIQDGVAKSPEERPEPTMSDKQNRQDEAEHLRGGTGGLGRAGEGDSLGPESGRRPLQMIHIRIVPEDGEPDRRRLPDDNQVRPGGTVGTQRKQTEESASLQEPVLWVHPQTFVEAILSGWDAREVRPHSASRIPPILRFNQRLRDVFLRELYPVGVYDNRLRTAMAVFTEGGWLRYDEVRAAMGGSLTAVRAQDTGRFSAAYSGNAPINDQDQIRVPNFFSASGVIVPADLFSPLREHYSRSVLGIFDLARDDRVGDAVPIRSLPIGAGETGERGRSNLLQSLEMIRQQAIGEAN